MRHILHLSLLLGLLGFVGTPLVPDVSAKTRAKVLKVLVLQPESSGLSAEEKQTIYKFMQTRLTATKRVTLMPAPEGELTDLMIDLECIDLDAECLTKVGQKFGAARVVYLQVDKAEAGYKMVFRVVHSAKGKSLRDKADQVGSFEALNSATQAHLDAVFGAPKKPKPKKGKLVVDTGVADAEITINGAAAGKGRVSVDKVPGKYRIHVKKDGYKEVLIELNVEPGKTVSRTLELSPLVKAEPLTDVSVKPSTKVEDDDEAFYETWWFWTALGVVVAGTTTAVILTGQDNETGPTGTVIFAVEPAKAWQDRAVQNGGLVQ